MDISHNIDTNLFTSIFVFIFKIIFSRVGFRTRVFGSGSVIVKYFLGYIDTLKG